METALIASATLIICAVIAAVTAIIIFKDPPAPEVKPDVERLEKLERAVQALTIRSGLRGGGK